MNEQQPYEDKQWDDLPLPDQELAWQKMQVLLDKEDKRRRLLPFWFCRYAGFGLLLLGIAGGLWLWSNNDKKESRSTHLSRERPDQIIRQEEKHIVSFNKEKKVIPPAETNVREKEVSKTISSDKTRETSQEPMVTNKQSSNINKSRIVNDKKLGPKKSNSKQVPLTGKRDEDFPLEKKPGQQSLVTIPTNESGRNDSLQLIGNPPPDSSRKDLKDSLPAPMVDTSIQKKDTAKKKAAFVFSAGVGLQQAIAVNGQQSSSYHYSGKKGFLADHVPSLYLRLQKGKWFAQGEFYFSVPQPVEQFSFSQKTRYDVSSNNLNTERFTIQKLYYHQLPFSINYHVSPEWSVGMGGVYNLLAGAITEQEITSRNMQTGDEVITKNLAPVKGFKDSFLYKTTAALMVQSDYHWKRFSLGLRFMQNLQPFIRYTKPDGEVWDKKNSVLQAIVRIRLWNN